MTGRHFQTAAGTWVPALSTEQMRRVDRVAMDEFGLSVLQMMENAGRSLTENAMDMLGTVPGKVVVLAGAGGNGGGGLCCARHLHNHGSSVGIVLDREPEALAGAAGAQWHILQAAGLGALSSEEVVSALSRADLVIDALIGYSLLGAPHGRAAELIALCNIHAARVLALDVPSGLNATTGAAPGVVVRPERTLTLALPKTGLWDVPGDLYLADIGIPAEVYLRLGISLTRLFDERYWLPLDRIADPSPAKG